MSRALSDLHPLVRTKAEAFLHECERQGITVLVTCTKRSIEEQAALWAQGRTAPGKRVTKARPGDSWHNWGRAFDVVPIRNGKLVWGINGADLQLWQRIGKIGQGVGLEWGGSWVKFPDMPHFQDTLGQTLADLKRVANMA